MMLMPFVPKTLITSPDGGLRFAPGTPVKKPADDDTAGISNEPPPALVQVASSINWCFQSKQPAASAHYKYEHSKASVAMEIVCSIGRAPLKVGR